MAVVFFSRDTRDVRETPPKSYQSLILIVAAFTAAEHNIAYAHMGGGENRSKSCGCLRFNGYEAWNALDTKAGTRAKAPLKAAFLELHGCRQLVL